MNPRLLMVLNRRLDRVFIEMECAWAVYKQNKRDDAALSRYTSTLRRADRLWKKIKTFTKP